VKYRDPLLALVLVGLAAVATQAIPEPPLAIAVLGALCLVATAVLRHARTRTVTLSLGSLLLVLAGAEYAARLATPQAHGVGLSVRSEPASWTDNTQPGVGYGLIADRTVRARADLGDRQVYRATYSIGDDGARRVPGNPPSGRTALFVGDSFTFGQGLDDADTVAARFVALAPGWRAINLGVPGYAPNNVLRGFEIGRTDRFTGAGVDTVVFWAIPAQLDRVTGHVGWIGTSPRYVLDGSGKPVFTGSFDAHRTGDPLHGMRHWARHTLRLGALLLPAESQAGRERLYLSLVLRLAELIRDRHGAKLVVLHSWPDAAEGTVANAERRFVFEGLRAAGIALIDANEPPAGTAVTQLTIPHDGHPSADGTRVVAERLAALLAGR